MKSEKPAVKNHTQDTWLELLVLFHWAAITRQLPSLTVLKCINIHSPVFFLRKWVWLSLVPRPHPAMHLTCFPVHAPHALRMLCACSIYQWELIFRLIRSPQTTENTLKHKTKKNSSLHTLCTVLNWSMCKCVGGATYTADFWNTIVSTTASNREQQCFKYAWSTHNNT